MLKNSFWIVVVGLFIVGTGIKSIEARVEVDDEVRNFITQFQADPSSVINQAPLKRDYKNAPEFKKRLDAFKARVQNSGEELREIVIANSDQKVPVSARRGSLDEDDPSRILGDDYVRKLADLPTEGVATKQMGWSNDYWPITFGSLSVRYAVSREYKSFMEAYNQYRQPFSLWTLLKSVASKLLPKSWIDKWSPAEKLDILMGDVKGDRAFPLTNFLKKEGLAYIRGDVEVKTNKKTGEIEKILSQTKTVPLWMGKCHGWAAASTVVPKVIKGITLKSPSGQEVYFHPDDIRGLITLQYSQSPVASLFVGSRCNKKLETDNPSEKIAIHEPTGAIWDDACFDNNPRTFHHVIANQVGIRKKSVVIDATLDAEVWNHPVREYSSIYFNLDTMEETYSVEKAKVAYGRKKDQLLGLRNEKWSEAHTKSKRLKAYQRKHGKEFRPTSVVGVITELTYLVETRPKHNKPAPDEFATAYYVYDLELDADGNMVGGEWYMNQHPDFMWAVDPARTVAQSEIDRLIQEGEITYDGTQKSMAALSALRLKEAPDYSLSALSSLSQGAPLELILDHMISQTAEKL